MNEFIHIRHLEQAAERFKYQAQFNPRCNWVMCLSGALHIYITGMIHTYHHTWSEDLWSEDPDRAIVFNLRRIPR